MSAKNKQIQKYMYRVVADVSIEYAKETTVFSNFSRVSTHHNPLFL